MKLSSFGVLRRISLVRTRGDAKLQNEKSRSSRVNVIDIIHISIMPKKHDNMQRKSTNDPFLVNKYWKKIPINIRKSFLKNITKIKRIRQTNVLLKIILWQYCPKSLRTCIMFFFRFIEDILCLLTKEILL